MKPTIGEGWRFVFDLSSIYRPMTARPFLSSNAYAEYLPCEALRPFVACFWGTPEPLSKSLGGAEPSLVIPDTCMDIMFEINHSTNDISSHFQGINDTFFIAGAGDSTAPVSSFAIRFYFWAVHLFADMDLQGICNASYDIDEYFCGWKNNLAEKLVNTRTVRERIQITEQFLLSRLKLNQSDDNVLNALYCILNSRGTEKVKEVCASASLSQRQMERLFLRRIGIPIKKVSSLVRYQNVWHDVLCSRIFNVQDAVEKYGYADQPHLLNEFTRYHGVTPGQAKKLALGLNNAR
jgi:AraC-like DNA-binding protein